MLGTCTAPSVPSSRHRLRGQRTQGHCSIISLQAEAVYVDRTRSTANLMMCGLPNAYSSSVGRCSRCRVRLIPYSTTGIDDSGSMTAHIESIGRRSLKDVQADKFVTVAGQFRGGAKSHLRIYNMSTNVFVRWRPWSSIRFIQTDRQTDGRNRQLHLSCCLS